MHKADVDDSESELSHDTHSIRESSEHDEDEELSGQQNENELVVAEHTVAEDHDKAVPERGDEDEITTIEEAPQTRLKKADKNTRTRPKSAKKVSKFTKKNAIDFFAKKLSQLGINTKSSGLSKQKYDAISQKLAENREQNEKVTHFAYPSKSKTNPRYIPFFRPTHPIRKYAKN